MTPLPALWLPILVSAVVVFLASWIVHTMLPHHKGDFGRMPGEDDVLEAMHKAGVKAGDYLFPYGTPAEMRAPEMLAKLDRGPAGFMTVMGPGAWNMGASLVQWFVYLIVIGLFVAYVTSRTVPDGAEYLQVFRVSGAVAFLAYSGAHATGSIWYKRAWSTTFKFVFDGLIYALLTAGVFGWLMS